MKVYVYAICKNERKFALRWMKSMSEADGDLRPRHGLRGRYGRAAPRRGRQSWRWRCIKPWRFDTARNRSLALVPEDADVCVCTDHGRVLPPRLAGAAGDGLDSRTPPSAAYRYTWNFNPDGSEGHRFLAGQHAFSRFGYRVDAPCARGARSWTGDGAERDKVYIEGMQLDHRADDTKSAQPSTFRCWSCRSPSDPDDDRNMHYLGRECLFPPPLGGRHSRTP